jgi:hypothetical protein
MLVSHAGVLPRPSALDEVLAVEGASQAEFGRVLSGAVGQVVGRQSDMGIDAGRWLPAAGRPGRRRTWTCTGPLSYIGHERMRADIDRLQSATRGTQAEPVTAPT